MKDEKLSFEPLPKIDEGKVSGVYRARLAGSDKFYVGSTADLRTRARGHENLLKNQRHPNKNFQDAYNQAGVVEFEVVKTPSRQEAYQLEQRLLDDHIATGPCLNIGKDVRAAQKGRPHDPETREKIRASTRGRIVTEATREKMRQSHLGVERPQHVQDLLRKVREAHAKPVLVDAVFYPSIGAAAHQHGISHRAVLKRLSSTSAKFLNWRYVEEKSNDRVTIDSK